MQSLFLPQATSEKFIVTVKKDPKLRLGPYRIVPIRYLRLSLAHLVGAVGLAASPVDVRGETLAQQLERDVLVVVQDGAEEVVTLVNAYTN